MPTKPHMLWDAACTLHVRCTCVVMHVCVTPSHVPTSQGDPFKTLFVGNLSYKIDDKKLKRFFERFGEIKRVGRWYCCSWPVASCLSSAAA